MAALCVFLSTAGQRLTRPVKPLIWLIAVGHADCAAAARSAPARARARRVNAGTLSDPADPGVNNVPARTTPLQTPTAPECSGLPMQSGLAARGGAGGAAASPPHPPRQDAQLAQPQPGVCMPTSAPPAQQPHVVDTAQHCVESARAGALDVRMLPPQLARGSALGQAGSALEMQPSATLDMSSLHAAQPQQALVASHRHQSQVHACQCCCAKLQSAWSLLMPVTPTSCACVRCQHSLQCEPLQASEPV